MRFAMTVLEDLLPLKYTPKKKILDQIGIKGTKVYKKPIDKCHYCSSDDIVMLEILGAGDEALFWMCQGCGELHLRFGPRKTEGLLKKAYGSFTNPKTWGYDTKDDYN